MSRNSPNIINWRDFGAVVPTGIPSIQQRSRVRALIAGLELSHGIKILNISAFCDSQLVANQFNGEYEARDERIPRGENTQADALEALASTSDPGLKRVIHAEFIEHPSIGATGTVNLLNTLDNPTDENEPVDIEEDL